MRHNVRNSSPRFRGSLFVALIGGVALLGACTVENPDAIQDELNPYGKQSDNCEVLEQTCAEDGKRCEQFRKRCGQIQPTDQCCDVLIDCMNNLWSDQDPTRPDAETNGQDSEGKEFEGSGTLGDEPYSCKRVQEVCDVKVFNTDADGTKTDDDGLIGQGGQSSYQELYSRLCIEPPPPGGLLQPAVQLPDHRGGALQQQRKRVRSGPCGG